MTTYVLVRDVLFATRIADAAVRHGNGVRRIDDPDQLPVPAEVGLLIIDWGDRERSWADQISAWKARASGESPPRLLLVGSSTDREGQRQARVHDLGPVTERSSFVSQLPTLFAELQTD